MRYFLVKWGGVGVAVFFFFSGYGLLHNYIEKGRSYLSDFPSKRIIKVIFPFIGAIIIFQIFRMLFVDNSYPGRITDGEVNSILPFSWYVFVVLVLYVFFYLSFIIRTPLVIGESICCLLTLAFFLFLRYVLCWDEYWYKSLVGFIIGLILKHNENRIKRTKPAVIILLPFLIFVLSYLIHNYILSIVMYTLIVVLPLYIARINSSILLFLGGISYEIYLMQGVPISFLKSQYCFVENDILYIIGVLAFTIILAGFLKLTLKRI